MSELQIENARKISRYSTRTLYVGKSNENIWRTAITFCKMNNIALSKFVADALRCYLDKLRIDDEI